MSSVSVVIPCYNYARYLEGCVESVLGQAGADVRVLVIDDASGDDSAAVGERLAARDARVEFRRHGCNLGHIATYNEGLRWADGEYVLLLSADDLLTPGSLQRAMRVMDAHPEVGFTYGRAIEFETGDPSLPVVPDSVGCPYRIVAYPEFLRGACEGGQTGIASPTVLVRNRLHRQVGGYLERLPHSGDTELWLRLASHAAVGVLDADQAYRRWHRANMTHDYTPVKRLREQKAAFDVHFAGCGGPPEALRRVLDHALASSAFWVAFHAFERSNPALCEAALEYAAEADPSFRSRPEWSRLRWKRFIGPRAWSALRPVVELARGLQCHFAAQSAGH
jgi:glycosyltransferase involved in cell wall biosynthesis